MIKVCMALTLLTVLIAVSQGQDYLDGGYVSNGDSSEIGQYFTDPIFASPGSNYVSPGPVVTRHSATIGKHRC